MSRFFAALLVGFALPASKAQSNYADLVPRTFGHMVLRIVLLLFSASAAVYAAALLRPSRHQWPTDHLAVHDSLLRELVLLTHTSPKVLDSITQMPVTTASPMTSVKCFISSCSFLLFLLSPAGSMRDRSRELLILFAAGAAAAVLYVHAIDIRTH